MKIGFIGAGSVAQTIGRHLTTAGYQIVLSARRGPESLAKVVTDLGPMASAGSLDDAADQEFVVLAVPWTEAPAALASVASWNGRTLIDATNAFRSLDPPQADDLEGRSSSEVIAELAPGAHVIKAFNNIPMTWIQDFTDSKPKTVLFVSGDHAEAKGRLMSILEEIGFAPIDIGGLLEGGHLQQLGGRLNGLNLNLVGRFRP